MSLDFNFRCCSSGGGLESVRSFNCNAIMYNLFARSGVRSTWIYYSLWPMTMTVIGKIFATSPSLAVSSNMTLKERTYRNGCCAVHVYSIAGNFGSYFNWPANAKILLGKYLFLSCILPSEKI